MYILSRRPLSVTVDAVDEPINDKVSWSDDKGLGSDPKMSSTGILIFLTISYIFFSTIKKKIMNLINLITG